MSTQHTVGQGEHLVSIATHYGFADFKTIWDDPQNADLKAKRGNPNVLCQGDVLFIPDRQGKVCTGSTEQYHKFVAKRSPLKLRLIIKDIDGRPIANAPYTLDISGQTSEGTTDGKGLIVQRIPVNAAKGMVLIKQESFPEGIEIAISIGSLDPVEEISGIQARLNNLGYRAGDKAAGANSQELRSAIEEFQCDQGLTVDGKCGPVTQAKLKEVYGC
jgi:hypothetical protein